MDSIKALFDALAQLQQQISDAKAALQAEYDRGFQDGKASVVLPPSGPSQADLDAALLQVEDLKKQVLALQDQSAKDIADAVAKVKADCVLVLQSLKDAEDKDIQAAIDALVPVIIPAPVEQPV